MAAPDKMPDANCVYRGDGDSVADLHVFRTRRHVVSAWRPSPEELEEIQRTGVVMLSVVDHMLPPMFVGSESAVRQMVSDDGQLWRRIKC